VRAAIDSDLDNAAALIRWSGMLPEELDLAPLLAEARKQLHEEADYAREGAYMARFAALLEHDDRFVVPRHRPELSAPGALAMSHEPSEPIETLADARAGVARPGDVGPDRAVPAGAFRVPPDADRPEFRQLPLAARDRADRASGFRRDAGDRGRGRGGASGIATRRAGAGPGPGASRRWRRWASSGPGLAERHRVALLDMAAMGFAALDGPLDFAADDLPDRMRQRGMEIGSERELWHIPPAETLFLQRKIGGLYLLAARLGATVDFPNLLARWA
jgi:hypothetical protein